MADFNKFAATLLELEGGYQNNSSDAGNYNSMGVNVGTNLGISAPVYERYIGRPPTAFDMLEITPAIARDIARVNYWDKLKLNQVLSQELANNVMDFGFNAGTGTSAKTLQSVLNDNGNSLVIDGAIGPQTIAAANNTPAAKVHNDFTDQREKYYRSLNKPEFLQGWLNRLKEFPDIPEPALPVTEEQKKKLRYIFGILAAALLVFGIYWGLKTKRIEL